MSWIAPIGIPTPSWGALGNPIDLVRPDPPEDWDDNVEDNYYVEEITHTAGAFVTGKRYIITLVGTTNYNLIGGDNVVGTTFVATGPGSGTGTAMLANPSGGYPAYPRYDIPTILAEGTKVFVHGIYTFNHGANIIRHTGTEAAPCWITAYDPEEWPSARRSWELGPASSYLIVDSINFDWNLHGLSGNFQVGGGCDHILFRNLNLTGIGKVYPETDWDSPSDVYNATAFPVQSSGSLSVDPTEHLIWYNVNITRTGNFMFSGGGDIDGHGISIAFPIQDCWIVDTNFSYSTGCAIQIGAGSGPETTDANSDFRIYVGRCTAHSISQSAFWSKRSQDCVFSQNVAYNMRRDNPESPHAAGFGAQYGARNCWFIYNTVYSSQHGIFIADGAEGEGTSNTDNYFIGNVCYDIRDEYDTPAEVIAGVPANNWRANTSSNNGGTAIVARAGVNNYVVNNTIYECDAGFLCSYGSGRDMHIANNIFFHNDSVPFADINVAEPTDVFLTNNLFVGTPWVCTDSAVYDTFAEVTGRWSDNLNATPDFVSAGTGNFRLAEDSAGIDAIATEHPVYELWDTMYGAGSDYADDYGVRPSIRRDNSGGERPWDATLDEAGGNWDIGAYEFGAAIPPPPPPAPTFTALKHITPY